MAPWAPAEQCSSSDIHCFSLGWTRHAPCDHEGPNVPRPHRPSTCKGGNWLSGSTVCACYKSHDCKQENMLPACRRANTHLALRSTQSPSSFREAQTESGGCRIGRVNRCPMQVMTNAWQSLLEPSRSNAHMSSDRKPTTSRCGTQASRASARWNNGPPTCAESSSRVSKRSPLPHMLFTKSNCCMSSRSYPRAESQCVGIVAPIFKCSGSGTTLG